MFAIQDQDEPGMLPLSDSVFFEFVPLGDRNAPRPRKLLLTEVEVGVEYVLLCSSNRPHRRTQQGARILPEIPRDLTDSGSP